MMRRNFIKRSFLEGTPILNIPALKFHLTPKILVRGAFRRNLPNNAEKHMESEPVSFIPPKSHVNFLGIESEEGVIATGSKANFTQQNVLKGKVKERFHLASFGVIRYDSDNKLKYHGQYGKTCDVFPHNSNEYSAVSDNRTKVPSSHNQKYNGFEVNRLDCSDISSKTYEDDTMYNIDVLKKESSDHNNSVKDDQEINYVEVNKLDCSTIGSKVFESTSVIRADILKESSGHNSSIKNEQNISYIDEQYFNSFKEEGRSDENNSDHSSPSKDLNFIDQTYFGDQIVSENKKLYQDQNIFQNTPFVKEKDTEYIDKFYSDNLKSNNFEGERLNSTQKEGQSVENNSDHSSISKDLNFIDQTYFRDQIVSENKKLYQDQNIFQDTPFVKEKDAEYIDKFYSGDLKSNNFEGESLNSIQNNESPQNYKEGEDVVQDTFRNQANISDKHGNVNSSKNAVTIKNGANMKSYTDSSNIKINLPIEANNFKSKRSTVELNEPSSDTVKYSNHDSQSVEPSINTKDSKIISQETDAVGSITSAYDFVQGLRKQNNIPEPGVKKGSGLDITVDSKGFRILKNQVNDLSNFTQDEIFNILKQSILYSDDDLMILNKPYSLVMHESETTKSPCLSAFLDKLANEGNQQKGDPKLYTVHRLDKETTGCVLLARNEIMAQHLKSLFAQRKIIKKYWVLTSRVPDPTEGVIDIPIAEGSINNKKRMVLHPEIPKGMPYKSHSKRGKPAVTSYKVLKESGNAALVEATPLTGIKHQIRVHFGFGLCCPILGDHKYSHLDKLAPQKLPSDILQRLHVRQSKVRYIPLHIHAKSVTIPKYFEGQDLHVKAPLPDHMKENLKRLKFKK